MERLEQLERKLREACPELELRREEPMARHTSFRVGGPAALMALPKRPEEASAAVKAAVGLGVIPFYMGNGSNLLVADRGYEGFVLKSGGLDAVHAEGNRLTAGSGILLSRLANFALEQGLTGLEFAHGIPGSLGGAVAMNAGAYGGEMVQVLTSVTFLDEAGEERALSAAECDLSYRHSIFTEHPEWVILSAEMELAQGDCEAIRAQMADLAAKRKEKQPLEYPSGGSTFKRPEGHFAAALIDQCGLKGYTVGGAQVSEKHAGFVVNRGGATCADVLAVADHVRETVLRETGVIMELEIKTLGL